MVEAGQINEQLFGGGERQTPIMAIKNDLFSSQREKDRKKERERERERERVRADVKSICDLSISLSLFFSLPLSLILSLSLFPSISQELIYSSNAVEARNRSFCSISFPFRFLLRNWPNESTCS
jgi:hypothetical protein